MIECSFFSLYVVFLKIYFFEVFQRKRETDLPYPDSLPKWLQLAGLSEATQQLGSDLSRGDSWPLSLLFSGLWAGAGSLVAQHGQELAPMWNVGIASDAFTCSIR